MPHPSSSGEIAPRLISPEFVDNPEPRCPVVLLLDTSRSMAGAPIAELNAGVQELIADLRADPLAALRVDIAVVTFGGTPRVVQPFANVEDVAVPDLAAAGQTPMGAAMAIAAEAVDRRKALYRAHGIPYFQPWVFLVSDGTPTDGVLWRESAARLRAEDAARRLSFHVVAVDGADLPLLRRVAPPDRPPHRLDGLRFRALFGWLSASLRRVSCGRVSPDPGAAAQEDGPFAGGPSGGPDGRSR
jgi:uncharacterized protein YegL